MVNFTRAKLPRIDDDVLKRDSALELREAILNQRMLDIHYAQVRKDNVIEFRQFSAKHR